MTNTHDPDSVASHALSVASTFQALIDNAPDEPSDACDPSAPITAPRNISANTGTPKRYRDQWPRPSDHTWRDNFRRILGRVRDGGTMALIGPRGTGKTRMAAEVMRDICLNTGSYTTAMGLFIRIRASFRASSRESEDAIVSELSRASLLVIDEVQERGNTSWEDRILTHVIDRRYGSVLPTIIIANLTEPELQNCLGESIISRLEEGGGVLEFTGPSHRSGPRAAEC